MGSAVSSPVLAGLVPASVAGVSWDPVERWLRNKKTTTVDVYMVYFKRFLSFAEKRFGFSDPRGFLAWAKSQQEGVAVEEAVESFAGTQPASARQMTVSALKTFLERNGYKGLPRMPVPRTRRIFYRGYQREEVQRLLSYLDDDGEKLYVLFAKDSGLRASMILSLRYHHVKPDLERVARERGVAMDYCHLYLEPEYFEGRKTAGLTFIGPNTVRLLRELIKEGRVKASGKNCEPGDCKCESIFKFEYSTLNSTLNLAKRKAGLGRKIQPSHGLRKFFENCLDRVGMDFHKKLQIEGHSLGVRWNYTEQEVEVLRPLYQQAYQFLDLSEEAAADRKVKDLMEEVKNLKDQAARYRDLEVQVEAVKMQMARAVRLYEDATRRRVELQTRAPTAPD